MILVNISIVDVYFQQMIVNSSIIRFLLRIKLDFIMVIELSLMQ